ncbi:SDR family NAD(P)-dependent oxidoreductase [Nitriliruptoraceae bacterium ZYF776]|nr:SDR family NAD(P)-dependent oxidoreductase [Profundirhabdus halotolerans]
MADPRTAPPGADRPLAVVTGAAGNVGGALVPRLTAAGFRVLAVDRPGTHTWPPEALDHLEVDLSDPDGEVVLRRAADVLGPAQLTVAAAGVTALGDFDDTDDAAFRRVVDVNLHGALRTLRATLPGLRATRGQCVVLSSVAGLLPVLGRPAYVGAKHAVTGTFRALAAELAPDGVAVTVLHPTFLATPVLEVGAGAVDRSVTGAALTADDVAGAVLRLVARHHAGRRVPTRQLLGRTARVADLAARLAPEAALRLAARRLR